MKETNNQKDLQKKPTRTRSPAYPSVSLREAVDRAKLIYDKETKNPVGRDAIGQHWGYQSNSSGLHGTIAALRKFGLIDKDESGKGNLKLTELALDILIYNEDDTRRTSALKVAALHPKIHQELFDKYSTLPSDTNLRSYLLREKNFNPKSADEFIKDFKDTISFVNLNFGDKIEGREDRAEEDLLNKPMIGTLQSKQNIEKPPLQHQANEAYFPLPSGSAYIRLPNKMTEQDKTILFTYLDTWKGIIAVTKDS